MTGLLHEKELSRKSFVKAGGALVVGFSLAGVASKAQAASGSLSPYGSNPIDPTQIDSWIVISPDNTASIKAGLISQGTGSETGILMIAAEELDLDMSQISLVQSDTAITPDTGKHSASDTIAFGAGRGVRTAAASAQQVLMSMASTQLGVPTSSLTVSKGVVSGGGKSVTYGDLVGGKLFNVTMPASYSLQTVGPAGFRFAGGLGAGQSPAKPVSAYTIVGTSVPRIDIPAIVTGSYTYVQNVRVPGMLHGRIVRPRGQRVYGFGVPIVSVDESSITHIPGVQVIRKNDFLGVVAPHEYDAIQAAAELKVKWADPPAVLEGSGNEFKHMRALDSAGTTVQYTTPTVNGATVNSGDVGGALATAAHVVSETYGWPTNVHTPIGPQCSIADVTPQGVRVFSGTQGPSGTQQMVASVLGLPLNQVRVTCYPMGGCYGDGAQYYDTAQAAALMSQQAGAPVRVQLMRWDEIGWGQTSPGSLMDVRAGTDANGNLVAFDWTHFYPQYWTDSATQQTNAALAGAPIPVPSSGISGNMWPVPMYNVPNARYLLKSIPLQNNWIKVYWMRGGSSPHATFAGEQVMDELAHAAGMDPVAFRVQNLTLGDPTPFPTALNPNQGQTRGALLAVIDAVTKTANWQPRVTASNLSDAPIVSGRGFALSNADNTNYYAQNAVVADIEVNKNTGKISVKHIYQATSAGLAVGPDLVTNQIVGGVTQILSRLLVERYSYTKTNATSLDFITYPILRFKDHPAVTPIVVQRTSDQPRGVGEPVAMAAAAAVANAFFDATGLRMRTAPMSPLRVRALLKAGGSATAGTG
jgi:nicotinate dehydrogenase subunit B